MTAAAGPYLPSFVFRDDWADLGHHDGTSTGWAHHGIAVTRSGEVLTFHEERSEVLVLGPEGSLLRSWSVDLTEGHGFTLVEEEGEELLWIADNGTKYRRADDGEYVTPGTPVHNSVRHEPGPPVRGVAVKYGLDGVERMRVGAPELPMYASGDFAPTHVAEDEERWGGSGDIWVSDGYGQSAVHRFTKDGRYRDSLTGEEGPGRFHFPHGIHIDRRGPEPLLYIADRKNALAHVYDLEGRYQRSFGRGFLASPGGFAPLGTHLLIAEMDSRIAVVGPDDGFVGYLGDGSDPAERIAPGWPNRRGTSGLERPDFPASAFRAPHSLATDTDGNVYVSEWLIGGRLVKLFLQQESAP